jgi:hypothetical protein
MDRRIWILFGAAILLLSACTRSYTTSPFPENLFRPAATETAIPAFGTTTPPAGIPATPSKPPQVGETPTKEQPAGQQYALQAGSPTWLENIMHPEAGCDWMGVGGQVFDLQSAPIQNLVIAVSGLLNGEALDRVSLTGIATQYGDGGYEVFLSDRPIDSRQSLWVQVQDLNGSQLSEKVYFDTFADCQKNLILVNFVQVSEGLKSYFLPFVSR